MSVLAGFWGQYFVRKVIKILGRASLIVFILSGVIFASALTMGNNNNLSKLTKIAYHLEVVRQHFGVINLTVFLNYSQVSLA